MFRNEKVYHPLLVVALLSSCAYRFFLNIGQWLTPAEVPGKADVVVRLSGGADDSRIDKATSLLEDGLAAKVVVTSEAYYQAMLQKKVDPDKILKTEYSAQITYEEGLLVKGLQGENLKSAMVVTDPFHLYRVRWTFLHIFSHESIVFSFIFSDAPSLQGFWWSNPNSRSFVLSELTKIVYYWTCMVCWEGRKVTIFI